MEAGKLKSNKRKEIPQKSDFSKKPKLETHNKFKPNFQKSTQIEDGDEKKAPLTKRERRLHAKELTEARKKKRKPHYNLEQELASLWEKMRQRNIAKEDRSKLVTQSLQKMKGKIPEIAGSHVSSRVLQTCVKFCSQEERDSVYKELEPHFLKLACNVYAVFLVKKMLDRASKEQRANFISSLHGHVAFLLRHMVGSVVVEHAYKLGNPTQKQELMMELYSTELKLFKDLVSMKVKKLEDIISKLGIQKSSVAKHMSSVVNPILEKGIVDHSIIHKLIIDYLSIADRTSAADVVQQLSSSLLVRMVGTKYGSKIGILCVKHGSAKERKKIIKGMKERVDKMAHDQYGSLVLSCIVSTVDDTKLLSKIIICELQKTLKDLVMDKNGRRVLLQLLHPNASRYLSPDDLESLNSSIPSLSTKGVSETTSETKASNDEESNDKEEANSDLEEVPEANENLTVGGKKDPSLRRRELLVDSGLAESLIDICIESADELLRSNFGKDVIYEIATGGSDGILHPNLDDKLNALYEAVASLAAKPKSEEPKDEHVLENFHSSRTIRKLILDCPTFASVLWKKAFKGKCDTWAKGPSCKVISAFLESSDEEVKKLAKGELQLLMDAGTLKIPENKQTEN